MWISSQKLFLPFLQIKIHEKAWKLQSEYVIRKLTKKWMIFARQHIKCRPQKWLQLKILSRINYINCVPNLNPLFQINQVSIATKTYNDFNKLMMSHILNYLIIYRYGVLFLPSLPASIFTLQWWHVLQIHQCI